MKLAALFPGIGYTCQKPLMYYAGKLAAARGYEVVPVQYGHFPEKVKGDAGKMRASFDTAFRQAEELLKDVDWHACEDVVFFGKSIGTVVACCYARAHHIPARQVLLTPIKETFQFAAPGAIAFHGTADPWAETADIQEACERLSIPLYLTDGANHSLEVGDVEKDLATLSSVLDAVRRFMDGDLP